MKILIYLENGDEKTLEIPTKKAVCPSCNGEGTELRGGLKGYAFTESDREEMGDIEFYETMDAINEGRYDVTCSECNGRNVVDVADLEKMNDQDRKDYEYHLEAVAEAEAIIFWEEYGERIRGA